MKPFSPTHRIPTALAIAAGALLAAPAAGMASDTFGSRLLNEPANSSECPGSPCTLVSYIHPSNPNGDPYSGGAPSDGVITKFRVRAKAYNPGQPVSATLRVADISRQSSNQATASGLASGQPTVLVANGQVEEHATRVPVKKGNHLALDASNAQLTYNSSGSKFTYVFSPLLGSTPRTSDVPTGELLVQATVEADRDHDGFGDETQDKCPSQASTAGECDHTAPRVGSIRLGAKKLRYRLSEAGSVKVSVLKRRHGHWVGVKSIRAKGKKGANRVSFAKSLSAGRYRVRMSATDGNGNRSHTYVKRFRIRH
jgi:hypothetical protein